MWQTRLSQLSPKLNHIPTAISSETSANAANRRMVLSACLMQLGIPLRIAFPTRGSAVFFVRLAGPKMLHTSGPSMT